METIGEVRKYSFDEEFQTKVAACVTKSTEFNRCTMGIVKPEYFQNRAESTITSLALAYFRKYQVAPNPVIMRQMIKRQVENKVIRGEMITLVEDQLEAIYSEDISDMKFIVEETAAFAKHQAIESAMLKSYDLLERKDFAGIEKRMSDALKVGASSSLSRYNLFGEKEIAMREKARNEKLAGVRANSISTGVGDFDKVLYHKGFGRSEMYCFMGAPKVGKSTALAFFAKNASLQGKNVLFVTLEVSREITADRIEAAITGIPMKKLESKIIELRDKIKELSESAGALIIEEFPTGTMTPNDLEIVIQGYKNDGIKFDMIVVDYADIMAPNYRTDNSIENSKSIYVDLRAIAQKENVVMLTAMQTNREGAKSPVAKMEHVAEDFNKIRIPDLVISINVTDEERSEGIARLYFVASRNQEGNFSIVISQNIAAMQFLVKVLSKE